MLHQGENSLDQVDLWVHSIFKFLSKSKSADAKGELNFLNETLDFNFLVELFKMNEKQSHHTATNNLQTILNLIELISFHDTEYFLMWAQKLDLIQLLAKHMQNL